MQKSVKWIISFIIALVAVPIMGNTVFADKESPFEDGEYDIDYSVNYEGDDSPVDVDGFFVKPAILKVEDGKQSIQLKYTDTNFINQLIIPNAEIDIVKEDADENTRVVSIKTDADLTESMEMGLKMFYGQTHDVLAEFDVSDVPVKPDEPDEDEGHAIDLDDGYYKINASYLKMDSDESSSMGKYLDGSIFLTVEDGNVLPTITINGNETVTTLQVAGKDAIEQKVDGDERYETFKLGNLDSILDAYVEYQAGEYKGDAEFRVSLDGKNVKKAKEEDKPGYEAPDDKDDPNDKDDQNDKEDPKDKDEPDNKDDDKKGDENPKTEKPDKDKSHVTPDKAFEYTYTVKHATEDKASAADDFFKKPLVVLHKDGKKYIQLTVTDWDWIDSLKVANKNVKVVKENKDGSVVIQFQVDGNVSDAITLDMKVTVPDVYSMEHSARLIIDTNSKQKVGAKNYKIYLKDSNSDKKDPKDDKSTNDKNDKNNKNNGKNKNDNTNNNATPPKATNQQWDQAFEYNFVVKHATEDKTSAADKFFKKPATVLYKDGQTYIQLTITNWDWIKSLKPENGDIIVVQKNADGSAVVQFKLNGDLSDGIVLNMHVVVPKEVAGMDYDMNHTARIFLDLDSKTEVNASDYATTILGDENGKVANPQTGDTTNVLFYVLLLVGSVIVPSSILVKRRFAHR